LQNALKDLMRALKIGSLSIAVPIIQGGMGVGISLSEQPEILK
jgi:NAD(P)H-dependent flavin oxidoreductase YrpB (nitropropane dioxygenase family)